MYTEFTGTESYNHRFAKETLQKWIQEIQQETSDCKIVFTANNTKFEGYECGELVWRSNRDTGAFLEYPIVVTDEVNTVLNNVDEMIIPDGKEMADGISPTYEQCKQEGYLPRRIIDIVIPHKGSPMYFIEICHKNPISKEKLKDLSDCGIDVVFEIDASWITSQVKRPEVFKFKRILFPGWNDEGDRIGPGPKDRHHTPICSV